MAPLTNTALAFAASNPMAAEAAPVFQGSALKNGDIDIAATYPSIFSAALSAGDVVNMILSTVNMDALKQGNEVRDGLKPEDFGNDGKSWFPCPEYSMVDCRKDTKEDNVSGKGKGKGKEDDVKKFPKAAGASTTEGNGLAMARVHEAASVVMFENKVGKDGKLSLMLKKGIINNCFPKNGHIDQPGK
jgi:hypothetical protein